MLRLICAGVCACLLHSAAQASTVFRCEDAKGHITYTLHGCPEDEHLNLQEAHNPTPGKGKAVPLAKSHKPNRQKTDRQLVVVGTQQDGCGNRITGSARRTAMIRQQVHGGMTQSDVESALGEPDKITSHDGQVRYHYADRKGNTRQVTFDESGCVKEKGKR